MPKANTYIHTSEGEYSDYCLGGFYLVNHDFCFVEQLKIWVVLENVDISNIEFGEEVKSFRFKEYSGEELQETYFSFLVKSQLITPIEVTECHTGSYGTFEMVIL